MKRDQNTFTHDSKSSSKCSQRQQVVRKELDVSTESMRWQSVCIEKKTVLERVEHVTLISQLKQEIRYTIVVTFNVDDGHRVDDRR